MTNDAAAAALRLAERLGAAVQHVSRQHRVEIPLAAVAFGCLLLGTDNRNDLYAAIDAHSHPDLIVLGSLASTLPPEHRDALCGWLVSPEPATVEALRDCLRLVAAADLGGWSSQEDILGVIYGALRGRSDLKADQAFYTPLDVAKLLAQLTYGPDGPPIASTIYDPTCGSGTMLVAVGEVMRAAGRDPAIVEYFGQDIDPIACALTHINLTYRGMLRPVLSRAERDLIRLTTGLSSRPNG